MIKYWTALFFTVMFLSVFWFTPVHEQVSFVTPSSSISASLDTQPWQERMIPNPAVSAHAGAVAVLSDSVIAAAWFSGSREGAEDVVIQFSTFENGVWGVPRAVMSARQNSLDTWRFTRKVGNPSLSMVNGRLHLTFVSVAAGGWATSAINHCYSDDGGRTWSRSTRLVTSPFLNISTLVRAPAVALADGTLGLPVYFECGVKYGEWVRIDAGGKLIGQQRLMSGKKTIQPSVVVLDSTHALAFLRDCSRKTNMVHTANFNSLTHSWEDGGMIPLVNRDTGLSAIRLRNGFILLAVNIDKRRNVLVLMLSQTNGKLWRMIRTVEMSQNPRDEFSYPALAQTSDGVVHLLYTYQRQQIKHVSVGEKELLRSH